MRAYIAALEGAVVELADVPIWPQHWQAFLVFQSMPWRIARSDHATIVDGLELAALPIVMRAQHHLPRRLRQRPPVLLAQLRILESSARRVFNDRD